MISYLLVKQGRDVVVGVGGVRGEGDLDRHSHHSSKDPSLSLPPLITSQKGPSLPHYRDALKGGPQVV